MSKVSDGNKLILQHPIVIQETYSYRSVGGANKTVLVLECNEKKFEDVIAKNPELVAKNRKEGEDRAKAVAAEAAAAAAAQKKQADKAAMTREWKDIRGNTITGTFQGIKSGKVQLETGQDVVEVPLIRLSKPDRDWVQGEMKSRREQEASAKNGAAKGSGPTP